jgi:hypothetical protein
MSERGTGAVPRGIEVLVKKASVDPAFRAILLERRAAAASEIGLALEPAEGAMLDAVPAAQLEAIVERTMVPEEHRRAFLGKAAAAMLATLVLATSSGCLTYGNTPDRPPRPEPPPEPPPTLGISPDRPPGEPPTRL